MALENEAGTKGNRSPDNLSHPCDSDPRNQFNQIPRIFEPGSTDAFFLKHLDDPVLLDEISQTTDDYGRIIFVEPLVHKAVTLGFEKLRKNPDTVQPSDILRIIDETNPTLHTSGPTSVLILSEIYNQTKSISRQFSNHKISKYADETILNTLANHVRGYVQARSHFFKPEALYRVLLPAQRHPENTTAALLGLFKYNYNFAIKTLTLAMKSAQQEFKITKGEKRIELPAYEIDTPSYRMMIRLIAEFVYASIDSKALALDIDANEPYARRLSSITSRINPGLINIIYEDYFSKLSDKSPHKRVFYEINRLAQISSSNGISMPETFLLTQRDILRLISSGHGDFVHMEPSEEELLALDPNSLENKLGDRGPVYFTQEQ